jgi:uncharacterized protein YecE (DUF72 family)
MSIVVGCSGWNYADWRTPVYNDAPSRRWLELYAERFDTVEVNSTFYRLPAKRSVARWAEQVPTGFCFAVKVSRYLTHVRRLHGVHEGAARLLERLEPLQDAGKLGPLLWQLPETFTRDDERLEEALEALPHGLRHCIEFRHPSWFCEPVYRRLRQAGVALVIADHPKRAFQSHELTARWAYVRFHMGRRGRGGNYSHAELESWASRLRCWSHRRRTYAYFNNDWQAFAPRNARYLKRALGEP